MSRTAKASPSASPPGRPSLRASRSFFEQDPVALAQALIGRRLVRILDDGTRLGGVIVETEAYLGVEDKAAHSYGGRRTARNESMYARAGTAYVYFTYGMHHCMNVVCGSEGEPVAVLLRALEPSEGLDAMFQRRVKAKREWDLCSGPGKLCQALAIDRELDGEDLTTSGRLYVETVGQSPIVGMRLVNSARIGVGYSHEWAHRLLRWSLAGCPHVSHPPRFVR